MSAMIGSGRDSVKLNMLYVALLFPFLLSVSKNSFFQCVQFSCKIDILHPCGNRHWLSVMFFHIGHMGGSCDFELVVPVSLSWWLVCIRSICGCPHDSVYCHRQQLVVVLCWQQQTP